MTTYTTENIAALIGSRICHDLSSPIGAVNNGLELLALSGAPDGPEMALVADSAASATARISLFRFAFGAASDGQQTTSQEICRVWAAAHPEGRLTLDWNSSQNLPRLEAQALLLAFLCAETALPLGGSLRVSQDGSVWAIDVKGSSLNAEPALWACLAGQVPAGSILPAHVQFLLLPRLLDSLGRRCSYEVSGNGLEIWF